MKKALIGAVAIGAIVALRPLVARAAHKMSEHCAQMASKCSQMMASHECAGHRETADHAERETPEFIDHREAVSAT